MPPPPVTSTTAVVPPAPHYPPNPSVPQAPRGVPAPGPDISVMLPDAPARVEAFNKLDPQLPTGQTPFEPDPTVAQEHSWNLQDLFQPLPTNAIPRKGWPPTDPYTVYLMATLARFAYTVHGSTDPNVSAAKAAIIAALDPSATLTRVGYSDPPFSSYDRWTTQAGYVFAFPGTTALSQWFSYAAPMLNPIPDIGTSAGVWGGIAVQYPRYSAKLKAADTGIIFDGTPAIMTGHSLGGALAQLLAAERNTTAKTAGNAYPQPVRSVWTYGAPAFLSASLSDLTANTFDAAARVYLEGDPIPYATQFVISRAAGVAQAMAILAPGYVEQTFSTRHLANASVALVPMNASDVTRFRNAALKSLIPGNGDALLKQLIAQHSISSYTSAAYEQVRDTKAAPADKLAALVEANGRLDAYGMVPVS